MTVSASSWPPRGQRSGDPAHVLTEDGWRIAIHRYAPSGPVIRKHPIVLCHGLAANHLTFDVHPEVSLARHLALRGYLTLAVDLRGGGHSERPSLVGERRFGWAFDDYLLYDVPAAMAYAKQITGAAAVHWVGHSMGGILGYAHLARGGSADVRSMTVIGASLDYSESPSRFHSLVAFRALLDRVPVVPVGL
jgi:polyhydroxyalkanoate synthase